VGCVGAERSADFLRRQEELARFRALLDAVSLTPREAARQGLDLNQDGVRRTAFQILSYPHVGWERLTAIWPELARAPRSVADRLETDATYAVYLDRQSADIAAFRRDEAVVLDRSLDFRSVPGCRTSCAPSSRPSGPPPWGKRRGSRA
jgi:tRNA uridine 5-carboxymethylaminomethyl modification enzyme